MSTPGRLLARTTSLATLIAGIAIALMMLHVSLDVAFRYLLGAPLPGTLTIVTYYYMVIAAFVPLALWPNSARKSRDFQNLGRRPVG